ncbi:MAG TPA: alpha/beta hydrolase [Candidatus Saccharimonadaceae bacterium]|jgi:phospholipase/carboxylesterase|nr:alpha/beta hydrolase [Candidatus Saccharimonadaceae bacterium]
MSDSQTIAGFVHRFAPARGASRRTLLLLHGTGGDEHDLAPLGDALDAQAAQLAPRGAVLEHGMPRFFRRLAEGVFDQEDLTRRTRDLAAFVRAAVATYALDASGIVAVGFSNGANIAASLLFREPGLLAGAALFSPMVPFEPDAGLDLAGTRVLIVAGTSDPIAPLAGAERLAALLGAARADVTFVAQPGGHGIAREGLDAARRWLATR